VTEIGHRVRWPDGVSCAACVTFDIDAETMWLVRDPENARRPAVMSQARYEIDVGIPLVLEMLARGDVRTTFFFPGWVAERHPEALGSIAHAGHEIGNHGWAHEYVEGSSRDEELELIERTNRVIEGITGTRPVGYRAPYVDVTEHTFGILRELGFRYSTNMTDSLWPYIHEGEPPIVELPLSWLLDDAPFFLFSTNPPNYRQMSPRQPCRRRGETSSRASAGWGACSPSPCTPS
jgi:peptidoglycan-N-acetylglucosamine deacetylase